MTEQLSSLLHDRASGMDFDPVDLDLLTSTGDRRIRRRRFAGVAGGVVAVAAVSGVVVALGLPSDEQTAPDVTEVPRLAPAPSFATGSTIHTPSGEIAVGHRVVSYLRTGVGYVTADPQGRVWSVIDGTVEQIGQTDQRDADLVGDVGSSMVGWVDPSGDSPVFVVDDQATGYHQTLDVDTSGMDVLDDEPDPASFYALSDGVAYVRTHDGAVAIDLGSGEQTVIDPDARNGFDIPGAHDGTVAFASFDGDGAAPGTYLGPTRAEATLLLEGTSGDYAFFSPDGAYVLLNTDDLSVFDTATGEPLDFGLRAEYSGGFEWLDDDTLVALTVDEGTNEDGEDGAAVFTLLTCRVSTVACEPVALDVPNLDAIGGAGFAFPGGIDHRD